MTRTDKCNLYLVAGIANSLAMIVCAIWFKSISLIWFNIFGFVVLQLIGSELLKVLKLPKETRTPVHIRFNAYLVIFGLIGMCSLVIKPGV